MLNINIIFATGVAVFLICGAGTALLLGYLNQKNLVDIPNERSNHSVPVPRGGGIAVIISILIGFFIINRFEDSSFWLKAPMPNELLVVAICALALMLVSFIDDKRGLNPFIRLLCHFAVAIAIVGFINKDIMIFKGAIPLYLERTLLVLLLVWFINLYNFMDGIDGITGVETVAIGLALFLLAVVESVPLVMGGYGVVIIAAAGAFLFFNWQPARIFMGDCGSIPLGFITGWLLIKLLSEGAWASALIIPLYYLLDATITIIIRVLKGYKPWQAHREHFYQKVVQKGASHAQVAFFIFKTNAMLVLMAAIADFSPKPEAFIIVSVIFVLAMINKMMNFGKVEPTLKEIKNNMFQDIKQTFEESTENYNKIIAKYKNDKKDDEGQE